jgi:YD repeat-containing protein
MPESGVTLQAMAVRHPQAALLQATSDDGQAWAVAYDAARASVSMPDAPPARLTLALTVTGSRAFADAFRAAFPEAA